MLLQIREPQFGNVRALPADGLECRARARLVPAAGERDAEVQVGNVLVHARLAEDLPINFGRLRVIAQGVEAVADLDQFGCIWATS